MTYSEIISYIDQQAEKFHAADEMWETDHYAMNVIRDILQYCIDQEITFEGFDLELILHAEYEEDVPGGNRWELIFDLMRRIGGHLNEGNIEAPDEVNQLFDYYDKKFYPEYYHAKTTGPEGSD